MKKKSNLFFSTIDALHNCGALENLILIGSWCHYFYRIYFDGAPQIPAVRTVDIDLLVPNPPGIKKHVHIPRILESLGFEPLRHSMTGYITYVHPELNLEFLTPELGRGKGSKPYEIAKLHINAQGLRFLNLLQQYTIEVKHGEYKVRVPEPAAYVLHKLIVYERRRKKEKRERDLAAAKAIGEFLLRDSHQRVRISEIFRDLPKKWKKKILVNSKEHLPPLYELQSKASREK
jgi:hypothetical protein